MAGSLNKVQLIGRLGADPEIKQMVNGKNVARLSIATSQSWKDKNSGERKEKTEWHRIVIFNEGLVGVVQQYLKKGANVYIEGQLSTRKWKDERSVCMYRTPAEAGAGSKHEENDLLPRPTRNTATRQSDIKATSLIGWDTGR